MTDVTAHSSNPTPAPERSTEPAHIREPARIAVIGAGLAGLIACRDLRQAGFHVTVFDKSRGSGGRLASKQVNDSSWDMGAQFMRAHSAAFSDQLHDWQQAGLVQRWAVTPWVFRDDQLQPSDDGVARYVATPRMTALSRALLAQASAFVPSTRIVRCENRGAAARPEWWLSDDQGVSHGPFEALLINTPPQQALPLLDRASPAFNAARERIAGVDMLPCWSLLLTLNEPLPALPDALFVQQGILSWVARNSSKPGRDSTHESWVIHASHGWSRQHENSPREQVQRDLLAAFGELTSAAQTGASFSDHTIRDQWLHRWLYAVPANPLRQGSLADEQQRLAVAGDWCADASLEGAWHSGQHAAQQLIALLTAETL
ncbi:NAD(P)/FAD-dependent oxidoreductase [Thalassolituus sp. LLYu03]|uniref:NAD(P)/FAD-dependent oxidoreductase n=1 Tax=Thalassolituus sp. LLYu03 TaxID=3421656 RepID=UPI003D2B38FF